MVAATKSYEAWVAHQIPVVRADLVFKHEQMALAPFPFLRATFYRWVQQWDAVCVALARAPKVLAVGDLHTENFGTWRDDEGRLIWGINDFDEAFPLAYTNDLVRLATSARMAIDAGTLQIMPRTACTAILKGYRTGIETGGRPFVLAEEHPVLRGEAESELRNPVVFWRRMVALPPARRFPPEARTLLNGAVREGARPRFVTRRAGLGSLGHPRVVALAEHAGGRIAREAKALVGSGVSWATKSQPEPALHYRAIVDGAVRCADPFLEVRDRWVVRRLAPDCSRIDFTVAPTPGDQRHLLESMGAETANVHIGSGNRAVAAVRADLRKRDPDWLKQASKAMERATLADHVEWQRTRTL
jgi:hypothetical protein